MMYAAAKAVTGLCLLICAWSDLKKRTICPGYLIPVIVCDVICGAISHNTDVKGIFAGLIPAVCILIVSVMTKGGIGRGDAMYFAACAFSFRAGNIEFFIWTLLACAVTGCIVSVKAFAEGTRPGKKKLPMLTLACPIGLYMIFRYM